MKRVLALTAAFAAAVVVYAAVPLPPRPIPLSTGWTDGTVRGVLHVHTNRSDGRGSPDEVAAAAARAGLDFVVFTDHGDATRKPDPPAYRAGVLCLDGVEISTSGGHYVALGLPAAPFPLGGDPRDVVEDVRRLGGFGIAAHPDSPKPELRWREWAAPIDGVELLNLDTSWRVRALEPGARAKLQLARALLTYPARHSEAIATLLTASPSAAAEWQQLAERRRVVAVAGVDAHAKLELRNADPGDNRYSLPFPSYEASFSVITMRVRLAAPFTGDAATDGDALLGAVRSGHLHTAVDAWASPPRFEFSATGGGATASEGDEIPASAAAMLHIRSNAPDGFVTTLWRDRTATEYRQRDFTVPAGPEPAVYRVEIRDPDRRDAPPWLMSNPIYVRNAPTPASNAPGKAARRPAAPLRLFDGRSLRRWNTEADSTSMAAIDLAPRVDGAEVRLRFGLSGGSNTGQFAGATVDTPDGVTGYERLSFTARAERPMRISVQLRAAVEGAAPERWQRSVYIDEQDRERTVAFDDMTPVGTTHAAHAPAADVRTIMFIVDTTNTKPGASGRVWIRAPRLE